MFEKLKAQLLEAIANNWQGRALKIVNDAWGLFMGRRITSDQVMEIADIYDEWEKTWTN